MKDLRELGAVLFVSAHPDDEVWCAAGVMAVCAEAGQRVACVTATHGEAGVKDEASWPRERLGEIRARELEASLAVLGVHDIRWLEYHDGRCGEADEAKAAGELRGVIEEFRPDTILTFGPDGQTGHPDHKAVSRWTSLATQGTDVRVLWAAVEAEQYEQMRQADRAGNIFFNIDQPLLVRSGDLAVDFRLTPELTELKRRAFEAVESQFEAILATDPFARPGEGLARECFIEAKGENDGR